MKKLLFPFFLIAICACSNGKSKDNAKQIEKPIIETIAQSEEFNIVVNKLPRAYYPIKVDKIAIEYLKKDSVYNGDTTIYYFNEVIDKKLVSAFSSNTFEVDNFSNLEDVPINSLYQNSFLKIPISYTLSGNYVMVLFLSVDNTSEFKSPMISAVFYDEKGRLIKFNNKQPYIECLSTVIIDATIISIKSTILTNTKILHQTISVSEERKFEEIFGDGDIELKEIPLMTIEEKNLEILIDNNKIENKVVNESYKEIW